MPIDIEYSRDHTGVVTHAIGVVTLDDVIESSQRLFSNANFKNLRYWLVLRDDCIEYSVSIPAMKKIFGLHGEAVTLNPDLKVALVPCSASQYIRDILYESHMNLVGGFNTGVFGGRKSAEFWIEQSICSDEL